MNRSQQVTFVQISKHVVQAKVPTPTLPPSFETNSYIIQNGHQGLIIDVGSKEEHHLNKLANFIHAAGISDIVGVLVTHYHRDHTEGVPNFQERFGCSIFVHPFDLAYAAKEMNLDEKKLTPVPEELSLGTMKIRIQHVSGHTHGHIHALLPEDDVIFVGDNLAGDGSVWVGPKDGHMKSYYAALESIAKSGCSIACPGHGLVLKDAKKAATELKTRRTAREHEIFLMLQEKKWTLSELVNALYKGSIPEEAMWVAKKTVQCHLANLCEYKNINISFDIEKEEFYYQA